MTDAQRLADEVSFLVDGTPALTERERKILQSASEALCSMAAGAEKHKLCLEVYELQKQVQELKLDHASPLFRQWYARVKELEGRMS